MGHTEPPASDVLWRLEDLYTGPEDPRLREDRKWCEEAAEEFSERYKGRVARLDPGELLNALEDYEAVQERTQRWISFAYLHFVTRTQDAAAGALWQEAQELGSRIHRDTLFFEREWAQAPPSVARPRMDDPRVARYRHFLQRIRAYGPHFLSEQEERVLAEKEPVTSASWSALFEKVMGRLRFGEAGRTEAEVLSDLYHPDRTRRRQAALDLTEGLRSVSHVLTHIFNTVLLDKAITDRIRNYPHWLRSRNLANEIADETVSILTDTVASRYDLVQRYYTLKRRLLGYPDLFDYDRYAPPLPEAPEETYTWEEARGMVLASLGRFSSRMESVARRAFEDRWIHAPVLPGKRSGAFSHSTVPSAHPYVLLNFTGRRRDVLALAHELGHAVHQWLARKQGMLNCEVPLTLAETASIFAEMLVFTHLLERRDESQARLALICSKIEDILASVFRQVALHRFEEEAHRERRTRGEVSAERLSDLWMESQEAMFGDSLRLSDHYRWWWSYIPHFVHSPGYVYAYAFGELLVFALISRYRREGEAFVPRYLRLLEAGNTADPEALLRPLGIDLSNPGFWEQGLAYIEDLLEQAEALATDPTPPSTTRRKETSCVQNGAAARTD